MDDKLIEHVAKAIDEKFLELDGFHKTELAKAAIAATGVVEMREALELATYELNAIRARDGAPQHIDWYKGQPLQSSSCSEEWWNELTEKCFDALFNTHEPEKVEQHEYHPSIIHMGDCSVCGNVADSPFHKRR